MTIIAIAVILFSTILLILCLPVTYEASIHIGKPYRIAFCAGWGRNLVQKSWSYTVGEEPQDELTTFWKKEAPSSETNSDVTGDISEEALQSLEKESRQMPYEDLPPVEEAEKEVNPEAPEGTKEESTTTPEDPDAYQKKGRLGSWIPLIINIDFLSALFTWLSRLIGHGQIRQLSFDGTLGLPAPHTTGILAGALYACCPGNLENLHFNFLEEQYDCTAHASGRLYPAMLLLFTLMFALSRPVRHILIHWFAVNKETRYG